MRILLVFFFIFNINTLAKAASDVRYYKCSDIEHANPYIVLLKEIPDLEKDILRGQIDFSQGSRFDSLIYKFYLPDQQNYIQIWYNREVRVDAQMQLGSSNQVFFASVTHQQSPELSHKNLLCQKQ